MVKICILTIDNNLFIIYSGKKYILEDINSHENIWNTFKFKYKYTEQYSIYFVKYIILYMIVIEGKRFQLENSTLILFKKYLNNNQIRDNSYDKKNSTKLRLNRKIKLHSNINFAYKRYIYIWMIKQK